MTEHNCADMTGLVLGCFVLRRLACSNAMFYQVHAVHDAVSAMVDALLDAVTGMPMGQQQTCSR